MQVESSWNTLCSMTGLGLRFAKRTWDIASEMSQVSHHGRLYAAAYSGTRLVSATVDAASSALRFVLGGPASQLVRQVTELGSGVCTVLQDERSCRLGAHRLHGALGTTGNQTALPHFRLSPVDAYPAADAALQLTIQVRQALRQERCFETSAHSVDDALQKLWVDCVGNGTGQTRYLLTSKEGAPLSNSLLDWLGDPSGRVLTRDSTFYPQLFQLQDPIPSCLEAPADWIDWAIGHVRVVVRRLNDARSAQFTVNRENQGGMEVFSPLPHYAARGLAAWLLVEGVKNSSFLGSDLVGVIRGPGAPAARQWTLPAHSVHTQRNITQLTRTQHASNLVSHLVKGVGCMALWHWIGSGAESHMSALGPAMQLSRDQLLWDALLIGGVRLLVSRWR